MREDVISHITKQEDYIPYRVLCGSVSTDLLIAKHKLTRKKDLKIFRDGATPSIDDSLRSNTIAMGSDENMCGLHFIIPIRESSFNLHSSTPNKIQL